MKRFTVNAFLFVALLLGSVYTNTARAQYDNGYRDDVTYQTFYDDLSPYGRWIEYPGYGYVWSPDAGADFQPYSTNGHWVWSDDYQWTWVSDYDWGWAPFHYGRWFWDDDYGWMWVPGYEWSGAWVAWRSGDDYYGWAPLRPGITVDVNFSLGNYYAPDNYWCFVPRQYITDYNVYNYCFDRRSNYDYIRRTTVINLYFYGGGFGFRTGPSRYEAERYCGRINSWSFRDSYRPGRADFRNNEISLFRPHIRREESDNYRIAPRDYGRFGDRNDRAWGNGYRRGDNDNTGFRRDRDNNNGGFRNNGGPDRDNGGFRNNDNPRGNGGGFNPRGNGDGNPRGNGGGFNPNDNPRGNGGVFNPNGNPRGNGDGNPNPRGNGGGFNPNDNPNPRGNGGVFNPNGNPRGNGDGNPSPRGNGGGFNPNDNPNPRGNGGVFNPNGNPNPRGNGGGMNPNDNGGFRPRRDNNVINPDYGGGGFRRERQDNPQPQQRVFNGGGGNPEPRRDFGRQDNPQPSRSFDRGNANNGGGGREARRRF